MKALTKARCVISLLRSRRRNPKNGLSGRFSFCGSGGCAKQSEQVFGALVQWLNTSLSRRIRSVRFRYASPIISCPPSPIGRGDGLRSRAVGVRISGRVPPPFFHLFARWPSGLRQLPAKQYKACVRIALARPIFCVRSSMDKSASLRSWRLQVRVLPGVPRFIPRWPSGKAPDC